jgi:hypothetical protein
MKPSDYVARNRITNKAGETLAAIGQSCDRVPPNALPWLLEGGDIEPKKTTKPPAEGKE